MANFDEWVTDPRVRLDRLRQDFLSNLSLVGAPYLGTYHVFTTSGATGEPAVILHDRDSWDVFHVVARVRAAALLGGAELRAVLRGGWRVAALFATGGHFGGAALAESARRRLPPLAGRIRVFSVLRPVAELTTALNEFQPTVLSGYPSAIALLAAEQRAGRLAIRPGVAATAGEKLTPAMRHLIQSTFGCRLWEFYAASEAPAISTPCRYGSLHLNADWYLLEPVDERLRPVPPGTTSYTSLVTNLANRIQPLIRYDIGDRITTATRACACGSPLPAFSVEGRTDDVLRLSSAGGGEMPVLPLAVATVIEETPGVRRFQLVRTGPDVLTLRLEPEAGADPGTVRAAAERRLTSYLAAQGVGPVRTVDDGRPPAAGRGGKFRQVWSET